MSEHIKPISIGIDPGNVETAVAVYDPINGKACAYAKLFNEDVFKYLKDQHKQWHKSEKRHVNFGIEQVRSYGMTVGATVFDTVHWSGRFHQWLISTLRVPEEQIYLIPRKPVKMHLCGNNRAKDSNIAQALCDRWGGDMRTVKGTKKEPGPLYGISKDMWAALAVAVTMADNTLEYEYVEDSANKQMEMF